MGPGRGAPNYSAGGQCGSDCCGEREGRCLVERQLPPMQDLGVRVGAERRANGFDRSLEPASLGRVADRAQLLQQTRSRPDETCCLVHPSPRDRKPDGDVEDPVHDRLRVDLHARVERDTHARRGGREPAELEIGECDVAERERHPPFVPELAAQGAASAAELDGPLPVAGLNGGVAKVVQRDRAVPAIADPLGELGQLRVDRVLPHGITAGRGGLSALPKSVGHSVLIPHRDEAA